MEEKLMAKKSRLLLICIAVACIVACMLATVPFASATEGPITTCSYKLETEAVPQNTPMLICYVAGNGKIYAMSAESYSSSSLKTIQISNAKNELDESLITDDMLWSYDGNTIKNAGESSTYYGKYLYSNRISDYNVQLSAGDSSTNWDVSVSSGKFAFSERGKTTTSKIQIGSSTAYMSGSATSAVVYSQQKTVINNPVTVTFAGGDASATGEVAPIILEQGGTCILPANGFTRDKYEFAGWQVGAEVRQPGDTFTVDADTTVTATWTYNAWDVVFKMEGQTDAIVSFDKANANVTLGDNETYWSGSTPATQKFVTWEDANQKTYSKVSNISESDLETTGENAGKLVLTAKMVDVVRITFDAGADDAVLNFSDDKLAPGESKTLYNSAYYIQRENYIFMGWKCSLDGEIYSSTSDNRTYTVPSDIDLTANGTITFTAQWKIDGFTLTFKVNDEVYAIGEHVKVTSQYNNYDFKFEENGIAKPEAPQGKVFEAWETTSKYNSSSDYKLSVTSSSYSNWYITLPKENTSGGIDNYDVVLTAKFVDAPIQCTFIIKYEDGSIAKEEIKEIPYNKDSCSIYLGNTYAGVIPENKAVLNWTDENDNVYTSGTSVYIYKTDASYTKTLTVHFADIVKVSFDLNGGTTEGPSYYSEKEYAAGSSQKITTYYEPTKENYTLTGWKCGDLVVKAGEPFTVANTDMIFVAQWKFNGKTLVFNNGATEYRKVELSSEITSYTIDFDDPTPEEGYSFAGWKLSTDDSETPTLYKKGSTIDAIEDGFVFEAQFNLLKVVTVTLHYGNETKTAQYVEGTKSIRFDIDVFKQHFTWNDNMMFDAWYTDAAMMTKVGNFTDITAETEDFDLYAKVDIKVTLNFVVSDTQTVTRQGTLESGIQVPYGVGDDSDIKPVTNYNLVGWATEKDGAVAYNAQYGVKVTTGDVTTFYAVWEYTCYDVTFTNGKTGAAEITVVIPVQKSQDTYKIENLLNIADPANDGNTYGDRFAIEHKTLSWLYEGNPASADSSVENNADKTFVAQYADVLYTVTFDVTGGETLQPISGIYGAALNLPTPVKEGYKFVGWYLNNDDQFAETTFTRDVTVVAHWVQAYTITFDVNGGEPVQTLSLLEGDAITILPITIKTGYTFVKWQKNGADFTDTTMPAEDITLTAVWQMNSQLFATKLAAISSATTLEAKRAAILDADALLEIWTAAGEDTSALDTETLTAAKTAFNNMANNAASDLAVAENVAVNLVATLGSAVALAAVALILKRRMF